MWDQLKTLLKFWHDYFLVKSVWSFAIAERASNLLLCNYVTKACAPLSVIAHSVMMRGGRRNERFRKLAIASSWLRAHSNWELTSEISIELFRLMRQARYHLFCSEWDVPVDEEGQLGIVFSSQPPTKPY